MSAKRWLLGLVLVVSSLLAACDRDAGGDKRGTKEFYSRGISLALPGSWMAETDDISRSDGRIILFSSSKIREAQTMDDLPNNAVFGSILFGPVSDYELEGGPEGYLHCYLEVEGGVPDDAEFHDVEINGNLAARFTTTEEQNGQAYSYNVSIFFDDTIRAYVLLLGFKGDQSKFEAMFNDFVNARKVDSEKLAAQFDN